MRFILGIALIYGFVAQFATSGSHFRLFDTRKTIIFMGRAPSGCESACNNSILCISQFHLRPAPPGLLRGICPPCQSRGWGICKFCTARGPGTCQSPGHSRAFDTHAVSYQNITTQKVLLEKNRLAYLSRTGINCRGL